MSAVANTIAHLKLCQEWRAAGHPVSFTSDPAWLVEQAINRRAGWPDDPSCSRGSCRPLPDGRYPPKASGDAYRHLEQFAARVNTPRLIVYVEGDLNALGEHWSRVLRKRLPNRFTRYRED